MGNILPVFSKKKQGTRPKVRDGKREEAGSKTKTDLQKLNNDLFDSAKEGHSDTVKVLIDHGADVHAEDNKNNTPLHRSALGGHFDTVKVLIDDGAHVNAKNDDKDTPLHRSALGGHFDTVKVLIDAGAHVNAKNDDKYTPLHNSAKGGHSDTVKVLIDAGADVHAKDFAKYTPLHFSASRGHSNTVKVLLDAGADVHAKTSYTDTPLHNSARRGHSDTVKVLIDAGADVHAKNNDNDTPLHHSALNGHSDTVKVLIEAGSDVNAKNNYTDTPLHKSCKRDHSDTVKVLIDAKADVHAKNNDNDTPLHISASKGHSDTVKILIGAGADVNAKNNKGNNYLHLLLQSKGTDDISTMVPVKGTAALNHKNDQGFRPLHLVIAQGNKATVSGLTTAGAVIDQADAEEVFTLQYLLMEANTDILPVCCNEEICIARGCAGMTLLHVATTLGCHEHIRYLMSYKGINVNLKDDFGKSPLHCAIEIGNKETIKELLKAGCDAHELDATGKSILHHAAIYGQSDLIGTFIESHGLDPYQTDCDHRNCLHYAVIYRHEHVVALLMQEHSISGKSYNIKDFKDKTPIDYLHPCEKDSLIWKYLHGQAGGLTLFELSTASASEECLDITNVLALSQISKQPHIGSVTTIEGYDNKAFIKYVKMKVQKVIQEAIPGDTSMEVIGVGSSFEGSKYGMPDEFDFLVKLARWSDMTKHKDEGYGKMRKHERSTSMTNIIGSYGMWMWGRLLAYWSDCESKNSEIHTENNRSISMLLPPQRHPDRKTCTTWIWLYSDEMFTDLPVSIDFVPAIEVNKVMLRGKQARSTWMMTKEEMERKNYYIVPKIPDLNSKVTEKFNPAELNQLGRVSYPTLEVEHIKALDDRLKDVFITAKCVRKPEVCGFKIKNDKGDVKTVSELVTSYSLKSVFLHLVELFLKSDLSLGKMVLMVYEYLERCLERENLPMFFDPTINVLAGSKLNTKESLHVTRMMTRFVRSLYKRDYTLEQRERDAAEEAAVLEREGVVESRRRYEEELDKWVTERKEMPYMYVVRMKKKPSPPILILH